MEDHLLASTYSWTLDEIDRLHLGDRRRYIQMIIREKELKAKSLEDLE